MAIKGEIVSEMLPINDILLNNSIVYFIPDFQRNFVWGKEEVSQLLMDLSEDTDNFSVDTSTLEGYLLGNIVLINDDENGRKIVVDGQQRLTTISLIFKALDEIISIKIRETLEKEQQKWIKRIGDIPKGYQVLDDNDEVKCLKISHDLSLNFGKYYKKLIHNELIDDLDEISTDADNNVKNVYNEAYDFLNELEDEQLLKFIPYIKNKVKLIVTSAPTEAKAFQLFEILNDRGRSLEPTDLIKNSFLKILNIEGKSEVQLNRFNDNWRGCITNLQINNKKKISSSTFLKQYILSSKGENIKADKLFEYFKRNNNEFNGDNILTFVEKMNRVSVIYKRIESGNYSDFDNDINMDILFKLLQVKQFHPLLMALYDEEMQKKKEILKLVTKLAAAVLFSYTQTNYIEKILPEILSSYLNNKDKEAAYIKLKKDLEDKILDRAKLVKIVCETRNFVGQSDNVQAKALLILKFIEVFCNENSAALVATRGKKISIEHILSRNLSLDNVSISKDLGFADEKEKNEYMHRLGNLTLLYNTDNSALGNAKYEDKIEIYKAQQFIITKTIVEKMTTPIKCGKDTRLYNKINSLEPQYMHKNGHWTKELIEERSKNIGQLMYTILTQD